MNIDKTDYTDWIEKYLDGEITEEENARFKELLLSDPEFAKQYQIRIMLAANWGTAKEYGKTQRFIAENIRKARYEKKNSLFVWSLAASFLILLSVSGIVMFTDNIRKSEIIAKNTIETGSPLVPQIKQAEEKGSLYIMGELRLAEPIRNRLCNRNDSIVFTWTSDVVAETNLVIENQKTGTVVYRERIKVDARKFTLGKNFLTEGEYIWYIDGFLGKETFRVVSGTK